MSTLGAPVDSKRTRNRRATGSQLAHDGRRTVAQRTELAYAVLSRTCVVACTSCKQYRYFTLIILKLQVVFLELQDM